jgi:CHAT domain-containing protein
MTFRGLGYTPNTNEQKLFLGEARDVATHFGCNPLLDDLANVDALKQLASTSSYIHLSCHGSFDQTDSLASSVQLADSNFTARDWMTLELSADLVTLSACQTGFSNVGRGDEIVGLIRALLYAGASSTLLTLWSVDADTTRKWMLDFYTRGWSKDIGKLQPEAFAFRESTLSLFEENSDPYYWAPFILVGDWR